MYKYVSSRKQRSFHMLITAFTLLSGTAILSFYFKCLIYDKLYIDFWTTFVTFVGIGSAFVAAGGYFYRFLDDPILGKLSFDNKAIIFYTPLHTIAFDYKDCLEMGITRWNGPKGSIYYVFVSKVTLTDRQKILLFANRNKKGKKGMPKYCSEYVLFEYTEEVFREFVEFVPHHFKESLLYWEDVSGLKNGCG